MSVTCCTSRPVRGTKLSQHCGNTGRETLALIRSTIPKINNC
uniref:Uncharacterized protein n=1 Tax=Anguilla anguilla TaxID=7936 RepID=A0A0E9PUI8_ANGAN